MGLVAQQGSQQEDSPLADGAPSLVHGDSGRSCNYSILLGHNGNNITGSRKPQCKMFLISLERRKEEAFNYLAHQFLFLVS